LTHLDLSEHLSLLTELAFHSGKPNGALFAREEIEREAPRVVAAGGSIEKRRPPRYLRSESLPENDAASSLDQKAKHLAFLELPYAYDSKFATCFMETFHDSLPWILDRSRSIQDARGQFIHFGIGGSALGAIFLTDALADCGNESTIYFAENVDPHSTQRLLDRLDPKRVFANVVSKSGGTVETIANFAVVVDHLRKAGLSRDELSRRITVTTNPERGALVDLAKSECFDILPLPDEIHGRFSVFSPTGLLTAAVAGVDIDMLLDGARAADDYTAIAPFEKNPSHLLAALHFVALREKHISNLVLLPYSDQLRTLADWYAQLVAESLGKGGQGMTPVKALGATDQHSQLQLYNDGPKDKLIILFAVGQHEFSVRIPESIGSISAYSYLANRTLNELLAAEQEATEVSLHLNGVPSCTFRLNRLDAFAVGALLTILEKTVCILGELCGVNAFDQPGVEESKAYARAMLGKTGADYDRLRATVERLRALRV
jgi:glucose-6-phosphate isomerase